MNLFSRLAVAILLWTMAPMTVATASTRDMAAEATIEEDLAKRNRGLVEPFRQARIALDANDPAKAVVLLAPVVARAPDFDPALRRYGVALVQAGKRLEGLSWLERALATKRSAANLTSLAYAMATGPKGEVSSTEVRRAEALALEATDLDGQDFSSLALAAELALRANDLVNARLLAARLKATFPEEMTTHYISAVVAAYDEHWVTAEREIRAAETRGLDKETVERFLGSGIGTRALVWRWVMNIGWTIAAWAAGLTLLCVIGFTLSKATLRQIEQTDPTVAVTPEEQRLRRIYRTVVNAAGMYYYVSLPVVLVLVILVAFSIIGAFFAIGWLPIKLIVILAIGALVTIIGMVRALFLRIEQEDPGRPITRDEAPGLWAVSEEVAATLNTRPIQEIRVTPETDLCVYERGNWREKLHDRGTRVLVLGTALLSDFKQDDFRCVLAHEYGHFSNRDTAGGDVALRVRNDMIKFYVAMLESGQATWTNVAFHFLRAYDFIFRRISHGATRLQEVLADRVAAQNYGAAAFEGGLRHVIRRSIEFEEHANMEINAAIATKRRIQNLYEPQVTGTIALTQKYREAINRPTSADDTHPGPLDRFRLVARVPAPVRPSTPGTVWDLFADQNAIKKEMTDLVEKSLAERRH